jgi:hypothetical protein
MLADVFGDGQGRIGRARPRAHSRSRNEGQPAAPRRLRSGRFRRDRVLDEQGFHARALTSLRARFEV